MFHFIKEITISGFKSFADKTTIRFQDGLTMIVGPNGCGKSNIIDAFCWGLGENRLRILRAQNHEELIFSGNDKRPSSPYASVSFTINNETKILSIDTPLVKVKRTLNKNGDSDYFINDFSCRLKDIQQLFMDTGLGRHGYSIMQQGKIEQIVTGKPQERRQIFEEASGISLSKVLIRESEQKLAKSKDNLNRLKDIISEVEVQVASLEKQAKQALLFKETKKAIEQLEKDIFIYRFIDLKEKSLHKENKVQKIESEINEINRKIEAHKIESEEFFYDIGLLEDALDTIKEKEKTLLIDDARISQKMELLKIEHENMTNQHDRLKEKQNDLIQKKYSREALLKSLDIQKQALLEGKNKTQEQKKELIIEIDEYNELIKRYQEELKDLSQSLEQKERSIYQDLLKKQKTLLSIVETLEENEAPLELLLNHEAYKKFKNRLVKIQNHKLFVLNQAEKLNISVLDLHIDNLKQECLVLEEEFKVVSHTIQNIFKVDSQKSISLMSDKDLKKEINLELEKLRIEKQKKEKDLFLVEESKQKALTIYEKEFLMREPDKNEHVAIEVKFSQTQEEISFYSNQSEQLQEEIEHLIEKREHLQEEMFSYIKDYEKFQIQKEELSKEIKLNQQKIINRTESIQRMKLEEQTIFSKKGQLLEQVQKLHLDSKEGEIQKDILNKDFQLKYRENLEDFIHINLDYKESFQKKTFNIIEHQKLIQEKKALLEDIGLVNFLAIEEYEEVNQRYEHLFNNQKDLEQGQKDLFTLINNVNEKATKDFMDVFNQVNMNLATIFSRAFEGGSCEMILLDKDNPLESGIDIVAKPPGKKLQSLVLLSGGEKTMVTLSLMFSLFMVKPSPFCLLDEVDAALDELNINRFLRILNDFKENVQFLVITHNRITAQKGDVFYGVTMQETGVSKVFTFKPDINSRTDVTVNT